MTHQPAIFAPLPEACRYLTLVVRDGFDPMPGLRRLRDDVVIDESLIVGIGAALVRDVDGVREIPAMSGPDGVHSPSTPAALWLCVRGGDRGAIVHRQHALLSLLGDAFEISDLTDGFLHNTNRDLTGYVDGTENPQGDAAKDAALITGLGAGKDDGSVVVIQRWRHDLPAFFAHDEKTRDDMIGRRHSDDEELDDAPASAHVKRTAQEDFEPAAFMWRRSTPWSDQRGSGLYFVCYARSVYPFTAQLTRMTGNDGDGITDALFRFTTPETTSTFFCPPVDDTGHLDLRAVLEQV